MLSVESYYLACLLEVGAPTILKRSQTHTGHDMPVSTVYWLNLVHNWFDKNRDCAELQVDFATWWIGYKQWIVEQTK